MPARPCRSWLRSPASARTISRGQFLAGTGLPPHQYVIMRRVERAKHYL
jgi:hypothetical protein